MFCFSSRAALSVRRGLFFFPPYGPDALRHGLRICRDSILISFFHSPILLSCHTSYALLKTSG